MKLSEDRLYSALNEYIDRVIMPIGSNMSLSEQFFFGAKMGIVKRKMQGVIKTYLQTPGVKLLTLVDEDGKIDVDTIYSSVSEMMGKMGSVEVAGLTFKEDDLRKLYSIMQSYAREVVT